MNANIAMNKSKVRSAATPDNIISITEKTRKNLGSLSSPPVSLNSAIAVSAFSCEKYAKAYTSIEVIIRSSTATIKRATNPAKAAIRVPNAAPGSSLSGETVR